MSNFQKDGPTSVLRHGAAVVPERYPVELSKPRRRMELPVLLTALCLHKAVLPPELELLLRPAHRAKVVQKFSQSSSLHQSSPLFQVFHFG